MFLFAFVRDRIVRFRRARKQRLKLVICECIHRLQPEARVPAIEQAVFDAGYYFVSRDRLQQLLLELETVDLVIERDHARLTYKLSPPTPVYRPDER